MKGGLFLDVVVRQGAAIFELFTGKDKTLLIWWDPFFVLDFGLDVFDGIRSFNLKSDGFSGESFDKNLHSTTETEHQVLGTSLAFLLFSWRES